MNWTALKSRFLPLLFLGAVLGCTGGTNPAAPPAPPAELPTALRYPSDLSIDVGTVSGNDTSAGLVVSTDRGPVSGAAALVGTGGDFSQEIALGSIVYEPLSQRVNDLLQPLPTFDIPVSPETTTFEITVPFEDPFQSTGGTGSQPETQPTALTEGTTNMVDIKIDFADFDFDGDGKTEGCSGNTAGLPICYRIWFNGQQRMAGVFTDFPTADNQAAGFFRVIRHQLAQTDEPALDAYTGVIYDDRDPENKSTEIYERYVAPGAPADERFEDVPDLHSFVSQEGPDDIARKRLAVSASGLTEASFGSIVTGTPADVAYLGQWREDSIFWCGSVQSENLDIQNFSDVCALIPTGDAANQGNCLDLGIDVGDLSFLDFPTTDDVALPADFPLSPTF